MAIDKHNEHLLEKIQQLENQLQQEKHSFSERDKQLQMQLSYLSRDLDTLFASMTWRIGYGCMNLYRKIMNLFGHKHHGQYMNADHFKYLIENCEFYTHRKTTIHPTLNDTLAGKFPKGHYEPTEVKIVLKDLWQAQQQQKNAT